MFQRFSVPRVQCLRGWWSTGLMFRGLDVLGFQCSHGSLKPLNSESRDHQTAGTVRGITVTILGTSNPGNKEPWEDWVDPIFMVMCLKWKCPHHLILCFERIWIFDGLNFLMNMNEYDFLTLWCFTRGENRRKFLSEIIWGVYAWGNNEPNLIEWREWGRYGRDPLGHDGQPFLFFSIELCHLVQHVGKENDNHEPDCWNDKPVCIGSTSQFNSVSSLAYHFKDLNVI